MEAKSLTKKRRKYNDKINTIKKHLNDYYECKYLSELRNYDIDSVYYVENKVIQDYPFIKKIYNHYYDLFILKPHLFNNNASYLNAHIAKMIVKRLEYMLINYKHRIKEIDRHLYK